MTTKTCNLTGNCCYKVCHGTYSGCKYEHLCDYQAPKDSKNEDKPIVIDRSGTRLVFDDEEENK